jgi:hypothetical protein
MVIREMGRRIGAGGGRCVNPFDTVRVKPMTGSGQATEAGVTQVFGT